MKKVLIISMFFFTAYTAQAQFGNICVDCYSSIEAGAVLSNVSGLPNASSKPGFYIGFYNYRWISDSFALRGGTSYQTLGAEVDGFDDNLTIHSINLPLSVHYTYQNKFQGFVGGELGVNFFGSLPNDDQTTSGFDNSFEFRDTISLLDASVFVGAGVIISENIDINIKYNLGLTDIRVEELSSTGDEWKKNWFTLSVGYTWRDY